MAMFARLLLAAGEMDHHEAAAADIAGARIGHRHREADRDRGIDRVAAALEDVGADARRARLLRHHHAVAGGDRLRPAEIRGRRAAPARRPSAHAASSRSATSARRDHSNHGASLPEAGPGWYRLAQQQRISGRMIMLMRRTTLAGLAGLAMLAAVRLRPRPRTSPSRFTSSCPTGRAAPPTSWRA